MGFDVKKLIEKYENTSQKLTPMWLYDTFDNTVSQTIAYISKVHW